MFYRILNNLKNSYRSWIDVIKFKKLAIDSKNIVFYVENYSDWGHLNSIINSLKKYDQNVLRITSDPQDQFIGKENIFFIGSGSARTYFFRTLEAKSIVMTLTDLNSFHIKKSLNPVHYFYVFHSIVSTHRVYREHAFDSYSTILCVGEHHINEIKKTEKIYNLTKKNLVKHGYGRLDNLLIESKKRKNLNKNSVTHVLIAPSWGESSIVNKYLFKLIEILISANFKVTLRLHPMTQRQLPDLSHNILKTFKSSGNYFFDSDISSVNSLLESDIMISEWSGAAMDYAFSRERPVIFIDTPAKINNLNWKKIDMPCIEEDIRASIGKIISIENIGNISEIIRQMLANTNSWSNNIRKARQKSVYNIGTSGKIGAKIIYKALFL